MVKNVLYSLLFSLFCFSALAQPTLNKYMENIAYFNPAALTYRSCDSLKITSFFRDQWIGLQGRPQHFTAMAEYNLRKINSAIGLNYSHDRIGLSKNNELGISYRYSIRFKNERALSAGASIDLNNMRMKGVFILGPNDMQEVNSADTKISSRFGLFYSSKSLLLGASVFHPFEPVFQLEFLQSTQQYKLSRVFNLHSGFTFQMNDKNSLTPELIVFANRTAHFTLVNLKWNRLEKTICGAGLKVLPGVKTDYSVNASFGYRAFGNFYFGAAYEYYLRAIVGKYSSALELMLRYELKRYELKRYELERYELERYELKK